jgi:DNA-binding response OmpR family regulator
MRRKLNILVVEDDEPIRRGVSDALDAAGYKVVEAGDGEDGLDKALSGSADLVLLDLMLPKLGGLEVLEQVRSSRPTLPVIILTAMGQEADRVKGLKLGADDYVVKPFSVRELLARVEAVLRRSPGRQVDNPKFKVPGGEADLRVGEILFDDGTSVALSEREMELLRYLSSNPGRPVSRDEILLHVWQTRPEGIETRTIDMHVARLREKLGSRDAEEGILKTVRGKGYMFDPEGKAS